MNNKPVAYRHWMIDEEFPEDSCWEYFDAPTGKDCKECIPLYTHPPAQQWTIDVKVKELTDEEIHDLMDEIRQAVGDDIERAMYRMARAILRKAQENDN